MISRTAPWFSWQGSTLKLAIAVQPGAKRDEFVSLHGAALKIRLQAPPIDGRANRRLVEFLAIAFKVSRGNISLIRGASNRQKIVCIDRPQSIPQELQLLGLCAPSGKSGK